MLVWKFVCLKVLQYFEVVNFCNRPEDFATMNEPIKDAEENDELNDVKEEVESKKIFTFTWLKLGQK